VNRFNSNNYKGCKNKVDAGARYMNHLLGEEMKKVEERKKNWKKTIDRLQTYL
jgi:hypothetical protein